MFIFLKINSSQRVLDPDTIEIYRPANGIDTLKSIWGVRPQFIPWVGAA